MIPFKFMPEKEAFFGILTLSIKNNGKPVLHAKYYFLENLFTHDIKTTKKGKQQINGQTHKYSRTHARRI